MERFLVLGCRRFAACLLVLSCCALADNPRFESDLRPILQANCVPCHSAKVRMKDLNLEAYESLMKGSESGPVVVPGKPDESRLFRLIQEGKMPVGKPRLSEKDMSAIRSWIEGGAQSSSAG